MVGEAPALQLALRWQGVRTQPLLLPRADRPAAALVPSTPRAAQIMIELRNKHTLTGKLCCFQIVLCAQLGGDFLSQSLTSKGLCRRIHFRRMPSVNDGPSDMPDSGSRQLRFRLVHRPPGLPVRRPRVLLVQPLRARPRPSPQLRVLPVRKPPSSRSWQLRFASLAASRSTLRAASRSAFSAASRCARSAASIFAFSAASRFACLAASRSAFRAASRSAFSAALRFARSMASSLAFSAASRFACCAASRRAFSAAARLARSAAASRPVASRLAF